MVGAALESVKGKMPQLKFRCSDELFRRLEAVKTVHDQSTQQVCAAALARHLDDYAPGPDQRLTFQEWLHQYQNFFASDFFKEHAKEISAEYREKSGNKFREEIRLARVMLESFGIYIIEVDKREEWGSIQLWRVFLKELPPHIVAHVQGIVQHFLDLFRSSRRKRVATEEEKGDGT